MPIPANVKTLLGTTLWPISKFLSNRIAGDAGLIAMFHYIRPPILPGVSEDLFVSEAVFVQLLDFMVEHFCPLAPDEFFERLQVGHLPERAILLTFDDGSLDNVTIALPELQKRNLKGCFFVCPELINRKTLPATQKLAVLLAKVPEGHYKLSYPQHLTALDTLPLQISITSPQSRVNVHSQLHPAMRKMPSRQQIIFLDYLSETFGITSEAVNAEFRLANWSELQQLHEAQMLIGNHTLYHSTIAADGSQQFKEDVAAAFEQLEAVRTTKFKVFCFPYGRREDASNEAVAILQEQQVDFALVTQGGIASATLSSPWHLRRETVDHSVAHFKLIPLFAKLRMWKR